MPTITKISVQEKDKNRCNVYLDGEFSFGISIETAYKNHLKQGTILSLSEIEKIKTICEYESAYNKALSFISKIQKTKYQIITYLRGKGFEDEIIFSVIDKLKELSFINDVEYAKKYLELNSKNQGMKLSAYKLQSKGIKKEDIEKAENETEINHKENAKKVFEKYMKNKEKTRENLQKASRYLYGRGFSYEEIESVINETEEI